MYPWGDARNVSGVASEIPRSEPAPSRARFAVGDEVYSGACRGTVISVAGQYMQIQWDDGEYGPVTYPVDADYLTEKMPWQ